MDERFYDSLELNKILEMLSKECSNEKTKKMALGIKPCSDLYTVKKETGKTAEALELSVRYGTPNFYNLHQKGRGRRCAFFGRAYPDKTLACADL